ncbi:cytochrome P450 [Nocardia puris]|uniref:cytochrome P450 n=1 Tax=Nocardia TaxID=1817 RepID=UPI0006911A01|nr:MULTISPECIES: cytochrome P450 [Nocardia]MBF6137209.1 cytochrome P450 [Nocardia otitidiscaviarum]MBF6181813.1 cytochrome P450 [Nocardia otitidiscaviarum]MBF6461706.1 cytochrome P450 [Nocardia puris]MBF6488107.1 cytochrome P450 [Nocardia otitidiscaviarum]
MTNASLLPLDRLPHAPGRLPVLGDLASVDRHHPTQHEVLLSRSLGPIFQRKLLQSRVIVVAGAHLAAQACDETYWARCLAGPGETLRGFVPAGLFTARSRDPLWGMAHRILSPGFTQASMRTYHEAMLTVADDLTNAWAVAPGGRIDVHADMTAATLEVIARAGFGRPFGLLGHAGDVPDSRWFVEALARILRWASDQTNDLPILGALRTRVQAPRMRRDVATARAFVDEIIAQRRASGRRDTGDLLGLMLETEDPETGERLPDSNIRDQTLTFLVAGHETTAALLEAALHYIAADPALQDRLRAEVTARGGWDYDAVTGMRAIRNVLNETLRLHPPVPGLFRVARQDRPLGGYLIPQGRAVFLLSLAAQSDPQVWGSDADRFDPDRFQAARLREFPDRWWHPFGTGPRSCIGMAFAMHEATLLVGRIVSSYQLELPVSLNSDHSAPTLRMHERGSLRPEPYQLLASPIAHPIHERTRP